MTSELPVVSDVAGIPRERADAARNRQHILQVARALIAERGIEHVGMQDLAREACVGTGTLYRRFGDRAGLALALLDENERRFQDELLRGEPPLGPGAAPRERLHAFGRTYLALVEDHAELLAAAVQRRPLVGGPFDFYRTHLLVLLDEAGLPADREYVVTSLMSALDPTLYRYVREERGWSLERLQDGWCALVDAWLGSRTPG